MDPEMVNIQDIDEQADEKDVYESTHVQKASNIRTQCNSNLEQEQKISRDRKFSNHSPLVP